MRKLVVLKLDGDLEQGVRVTLEIGEEGKRPSTEIIGQLPRTTDLLKANDQWQSTYRSFGNSLRIKAKKVVYGGSITQWREECNNCAIELRKCLNNWLVSESFRSVREKWLQQLLLSDEVRVLIRTSNVQLRKLPWHLWDLIEDYSLTEVALSTPESEQLTLLKTSTYRDKVRILAILGNSTGINVQKDRQLLENLPDAVTTFLVEPQRQEINDQLWNQPWDLLFFAGHSKTEGDKGRIYINQTDSLTIAELRYALRNAVANGLQLAIFNSCDGLGLATELEQLHIRQLIIMREPVPDRVAQAFLTQFLAAFASGKSFYLAQREAREKLHGLEDEFPCASWLPAIFQNPAAIPPMWQDLGRRPTEICPYRGLFAFREEDAPFFYGRDVFTKMLVEAVQKQPLVAVIGPSGSGKSSVVFAGLIPYLRSEQTWLIEAVRPGDRPFRNLAAKLVPLLETQMSETDQLLEINKQTTALQQGDLALEDVVARILEKNSGNSLLLVVDQFEELYTLCQDVQERLLFLDNLLEASDRTPNLTLVLTLRADFLGQALSYRPFGDALQYADLKLSPMNREELQAAVEQPATMLGVTIESGLTERILNAVSAEPGNLPLLEFALNQLWGKQRDAQLTHAAYEEIGGVEAALSRYAEEAYGRLNEEEKERARRIFIQLVRPGEGTEDTRRLATRAEVGEENWDLVTRLASARLVVSSRDEVLGEETIEIVHEALIRRWERLNLWIELDRSFRTWQERLRASLRQWETNGRDEGALLRGVPLAEAEGWLLSRPLELNSKERSFIKQSKLVRSRQRRRLLFGLSVGLVGALSLAGMAFLQWQSAEHQRQNAEHQRQSAEHQRQNALAGQLAFQAESLRNQQNMLHHSVLLALEAMQRTPSPVAEQVLRQSVPLLPRPIPPIPPSPIVRRKAEYNQIHIIAWSPDGEYAVTAGADSNLMLWEITSRKVMRLRYDSRRLIMNDLYQAVAFSPDSKYLATVSLNDTAQVLEVDSGREVVRLKHQGIKKVAFNPNGKYLATVSLNDTAKVWEAASGREIVRLKHQGIKNIAFSPNSKYLATAGKDDTARIWEVTGGREVARMRHRGEVVTVPSYFAFEDTLKVAFSPDGKYLVTHNRYGAALVWNTTSSHEVARLKHRSVVEKVTFSADGKYLITNDTQMWETSTGREALGLKYKDKEVRLYGISPGGKYLIMQSDNALATFHVWDATSGREVGKVKLDRNPVQGRNGIAITPDGKYLFSNIDNQIGQVWETNSGQEVARIIGVSNAIFSPNGKYLATENHGLPQKAWLWDLNSTYQVAHTMKHKDAVKAVVFSADGKYFATTGDETVRVWSATSNQEVARLKHEDSIVSIAFSRDGKYLATASWDGTAGVWEITSGRQVTRIITEEAATLSTLRKLIPTETRRYGLGYGFSYESTLVFDPDGKYLAKVGLDKTVRVWEIASGREVMRLKNNIPHGLRLDKLSYPDPRFNLPALNFNAITFSPDGRYLATITNGYWESKEASSDSKEGSIVRLWQVNSGREVAHIKYDSSHVKVITFSPDGRYLATARSHNRNNNPQSNVSLWETASGRKIADMHHIEVEVLGFPNRYLLDHPTSVNIIAVSLDGRYLAGTEADQRSGKKNIWVWEATSGLGVTYMFHEDSVNAIAFSPDGKYLATTSKDKTTRVWQIPSGSGRESESRYHSAGFRVRHTIDVREAVEVSRITHQDNVVAIAFSPDGKYLAMTSEDKTARIQLWRREDLMAEACARLPHNFKKYEWKLYLPGEPYHKTCPNLPVP